MRSLFEFRFLSLLAGYKLLIRQAITIGCHIPPPYLNSCTAMDSLIQDYLHRSRPKAIINTTTTSDGTICIEEHNQHWSFSRQLNPRPSQKILWPIGTLSKSLSTTQQNILFTLNDPNIKNLYNYHQPNHKRFSQHLNNHEEKSWKNCK